MTKVKVRNYDHIYDHGDGTVEVMVKGIPTTIKKGTIQWMKNVGLALATEEEISEAYTERVRLPQLDNMAKEHAHA